MKQIEKHSLNKFPEMSKEHFNNLKNDMIINGYDKTFPVYLYEDKIIDGWNRYKACKELNIEPNFKEFKGDKKEAVVFILRTNNRRDLTPYQRSIMALEYEPFFKAKAKENLKASGGDRKSENKISGCQISDKAIDTKKELSKVANVSHDTIAKVKKIQEKAPEEIKAKLSTGEVSINAAYKEIKKEEKKEEKQKKIQEIKASAKKFENTDIQILNKDFRDLSIKDKSIDLILTDPPYPAEYLHLWKDLFTQAKRILKPNKFLVAYSGQMYLDKILKYAIDVGLDYYWTINIEFTKKPLVHGRKVLNEWKPILLFQNGIKQHDRVFSDKISMKYTERELHDLNWGQTVEPFEFLIDRFSNPQDLIYEPFAGTGTTLLACKNTNRRCIATELKTDYIDLIKGRLK
tara:strand:+ start:1019 stop:2230 length:1212 start_codon:yes stop_codon:yes gene_type:complete